MSQDFKRLGPDPEVNKSISQNVSENDLWDLDSESVPSSSEKAPLSPNQRSIDEELASAADVKNLTPLPSTSVKSGELPDSFFVKVVSKTTHGLTEKMQDDVFAGFPDLEKTQADVTSESNEEFPEAPQKQPAETMALSAGSLNLIEKMAIYLLCAVLLIGAAFALIHFSKNVPTRPLVTEEIDFPVSGKIIEITAVSSYWREPVTEGENLDVVKIGMQLIPELKLKLSPKSGAIRILFRNDEGAAVGDGITRALKGETELTVAATAGFENKGMLSAYRTGDGKRWVAEIFEGPSTSAPREQFRKILEIEISSFIE